MNGIRLGAMILVSAVSTAAAQRRPAPSPAAPQPMIPSEHLGQLKYRYIGPEGNRISTVAGVIGNPNIYYAGAASGGMFKTTDGGVHWQSIFDDQPVSSVGAVAVAPSDPNVVWAGTGEPYIRSNISVGWGVYKSTDAGKTWNKMGLDNTGRVGRIAIDPRNPDVVFVAALGHAYGPQQERGVYRTTDGGKTWERVLFVDENTGAYDVEMDLTNPRILFATTWQIEIHTWGRKSGGPGSGIWKSTDGGTTWKRLTGNGLPTKPFGKADVAIARSNPNRVYALIETSDGVPLAGVEAESGELWRSEDAGATWKAVSHDRQLAGRTQYYTRMIVTPDNENEAYFLTASWAKTLDGGVTTIDPPNNETAGGDHHDIWIDPTNGNRMVVAHDGGVSITTNRGKSWNQIQLAVAQMYHVTVDNKIPYYVYGNRQDGPSARGPSNSRTAEITRGFWHSVGGGESGWATPDPEDPNIVWSSASGFGSEGGIVTRYDVRTGISDPVEVWPEATTGTPAADVKYRFQWTFPLTISPSNRHKVYVGSQHVHATTDDGKTWNVISPDLTRNDKSRQVGSGGLTPDNIGVEYAGVVFAIAESRLKEGQIWAGTNDGLVQLTQDGGKTWTNLTTNIAGLLDWGTISNIEPSRYDASTAYLTVDGHQVNNRDPWVYRTTDLGKTWKLITGGIAKTPLSYAHWIKEDPVRQGLLYLGLENGLMVSFNDGESWQALQSNMPHAPVYGITVQEHFNDLVVATYGRGFWILDDITPLQQLTTEVAAKEAHLFTARPAYRFRNVEAPMAVSYDPVTGQNPAYGAAINYYLKAAAESVTVVIADPSGKEVRTIKTKGEAGLNRTMWDLRATSSKAITVRNAPLFAPELAVGADGRPSASIGMVAQLVPPGRYTVTLKVRGTSLATPLDVLKDPNSPGSEADIRTQAALFTDMQSELEGVADMVNTLELVRAQLAVLKTSVADSAVKTAADSMAAKAVEVEEQLTQLRITGRGQDVIRYPGKVGEKLVYLLGDIGATDNAPTGPQHDVGRLLKDRARAARNDFDRLLNRDLDQFNRMLQGKGLGGIVARKDAGKTS